MLVLRCPERWGWAVLGEGGCRQQAGEREPFGRTGRSWGKGRGKGAGNVLAGLLCLAFPAWEQRQLLQLWCSAEARQHLPGAHAEEAGQRPRGEAHTWAMAVDCWRAGETEAEGRPHCPLQLRDEENWIGRCCSLLPGIQQQDTGELFKAAVGKV